MRQCILFALSTVALVASESRIESAIASYERKVAQAEDDLAAAQRRYDQVTTQARHDCIAGLERLIRSSTPAAEVILVRKQILRLDRSHTASRDFFAELGTLDSVLAELDAESELLAPAEAASSAVVAASQEPAREQAVAILSDVQMRQVLSAAPWVDDHGNRFEFSSGGRAVVNLRGLEHIGSWQKGGDGQSFKIVYGHRGRHAVTFQIRITPDDQVLLGPRGMELRPGE